MTKGGAFGAVALMQEDVPAEQVDCTTVPIVMI